MSGARSVRMERRRHLVMTALRGGLLLLAIYLILAAAGLGQLSAAP